MFVVLKSIVFVFFRLFYKSFQVVGKEKLPKNAAIIFSPNHQNALMDALAVIYAADIPVYFFARADIFKNKIVCFLLHFFRVYPIYRVRDGYGELKQNEQQFRMASTLLKNSYAIGIMPEGNHAPDKRMRPLLKGIFRLAVEAVHELDNEIELFIVPVGIDYSNYYYSRSSLLVRFGDPINVKEQLAHNEPLPCLFNRLKEDLAVKMKNEMLHIENTSYYHEILFLSEFSLSRISHVDRFRLAQDRISDIESKLKNADIHTIQLIDKTHKLLVFLNANNISSEAYSFPLFSYKNLFLLLLFPVYLSAFILHAFPYYLISKLSHQSNDSQFISTYKFVLAILVYASIFITSLVLIIFSKSVFFVTLLFILAFTGLLFLLLKKEYQMILSALKISILCPAELTFDKTE